MRIKVLHVLSGIDPQFGGPGLALAGLAEAQGQAGLDVAVGASYYSDEPRFPALDRLRDRGSDIRLIGPARGFLHRHPQMGALLFDLIDQTHVVHIHALWDEMQYAAAQFALAFGKPYIIRPCGMLDPWCLAQNRWRKQFYLWWRLRKNLDRAGALHFTSQIECELTRRLRLAAPSIIEPNGINLQEFETLPPQGGFRSRFPQIGRRPLVAFLSRLHPKKGLDLLLPAFAQANVEDAMLVLAGPVEARYRQELENLAKAHRLQDRVLFTGMLHGADRVALLADADLFVLPSYQENFATVVIEALAAGTPVIISDQVNIHDQITAGGVGAVVPLRLADLAGQLARWLKDPTLRLQAKERARDFVWSRFDWAEIAARWRAHYERLWASSQMRMSLAGARQ